MNPLIHRFAFEPDPQPAADRLADDAWIRLVAVGYADQESLDTQRVEGAMPSDPPTIRYVLDWKVLRGLDVLHASGALHVSEAFVAALAAMPGCDLAATPVPHGSPNPVRGGRVYALEPTGPVAKVAATTEIFVAPIGRPRPYGRGGIPRRPLGLDLSACGPTPVVLTEWCGSELGLPWRGLVVRGDFVRTFERMFGRAMRCASEEVVIDDQPVPGTTASPLVHTPAPAAWDASPTVEALIERIEMGASRFNHHLPPPASCDLPGRVGATCSPAIRALLSHWNGASLFGGAIGFFAVTSREGSSALVGDHAHFGVPDDIQSAQHRSGDDDWGLQVPEGALLFGWRCDEAPCIWSIDPEGLVRLLAPGRVILGPAVPVAQWLHDQLEDLEYAAITRDSPAVKWLGL